MTQPKVGIFFFINGAFLFDSVPLDQGELYGDTIGFSGHYDFWELMIPQNTTERLFKSHDYDYFPRGRVVYFQKIKRFKLYADSCMKQADIEEVVATFELPTYQLARDEHYQCASCNQNYVDF